MGLACRTSLRPLARRGRLREAGRIDGHDRGRGTPAGHAHPCAPLLGRRRPPTPARDRVGRRLFDAEQILRARLIPTVVTVQVGAGIRHRQVHGRVEIMVSTGAGTTAATAPALSRISRGTVDDMQFLPPFTSWAAANRPRRARLSAW